MRVVNDIVLLSEIEDDGVFLTKVNEIKIMQSICQFTVDNKTGRAKAIDWRLRVSEADAKEMADVNARALELIGFSSKIGQMRQSFNRKIGTLCLINKVILQKDKLKFTVYYLKNA